ncbi:deoxyribonuclease HsdR [Vespertiliibacter pulmonis]|uniref:Zn-dependent protease with chaperone function n=1 Tax=Vespertiliibacter pulmonis TaxID=1443036 RepID=A0A3N4W229_9PAST|nr:M48 family metallopeptidase [Vespertiliibacter pulmonis]QLB20836.1 deoxyribonuclease HsdR [Vespertiliibacter pulmonis]RPE83487.1 Zn-dependent protease with chaperone function [Vespertiliibacter pulmonis]
MKTFQKLIVTAFFSVGLTACVSTSSINQEAANSYMQLKQKANAEHAIDTTSPTAKRIQTVFNHIKPYAQQANTTGIPFQWEIVVLKSNELNAWAMPGGKMAFYTGLVDKLNLTDDEIAVVMGHEMAHALKEHGKSDRNLSAITGIVTQIGKIALQTQGISTDLGGFDAIDVLTEYGLNKPFSRSQETEADEEGLMLMAKSGYNPEAAPNVWRKMAQVTGSSGGLLESIASTHPTNAARQENLQRLVPKAKELYLASKR